MNVTNQYQINNHSSKEYITVLANCTLQLAIAALWPNIVLPSQEDTAARHIITNRLLQAVDPYKQYLEICQRILLSREELVCNSGYRISSSPSFYLLSDKSGYFETASWYEELLELQKTKPVFKLSFRALAESVLEIAEESTPDNFCYWTNWFKENNLGDELMLFQVFCATDHYKTNLL